jgi:hypothetical protein
MGQAAVELPETTKSAAAAPTNADDLLSQLAGEEIDRMLAESDSAKGNEPPAEERLASTIESIEQIESELVEAERQAAEAPVAPETEPAPPAAPIAEKMEDAFSAEVNQLLGQLDEPSESASPPADPAPAAKTQVVTETPAPEMPAAKTPVIEEPTTAAERAALAEPPAAEPVVAEPKLVAEPQAAAQRVAIYVRALELINGPFASCSQTLRDTLGKVAILTFMNSLGVLLYVLLFKH